MHGGMEKTAFLAIGSSGFWLSTRCSTLLPVAPRSVFDSFKFTLQVVEPRDPLDIRDWRIASPGLYLKQLRSPRSADKMAGPLYW